jgi:hypothetical protein
MADEETLGAMRRGERRGRDNERRQTGGRDNDVYIDRRRRRLRARAARPCEFSFLLRGGGDPYGPCHTCGHVGNDKRTARVLCNGLTFLDTSSFGPRPPWLGLSRW